MSELNGCGVSGGEGAEIRQQGAAADTGQRMPRLVVASFQRGDLAEVWNVFDGASVIQAGPLDDREFTKKAAYWIGKNAARIQQAARAAGRAAEQATAYSDIEQQYMRDREAVFQQFARTDDDGNFVLAKAGEDREAYTFEGDNEKLCEAALKNLEAERAEVVAAIRGKTERLRAFLAEPVDVELVAIDFDWLPATMSGAFVYAIKQMLFNRPDDEDDPLVMVDGPDPEAEKEG